MPRYASETTVPVEKTRAEIEATVIRYNASEFQSGWREGSAMIGFRIGNLFVRFVLPTPARAERRFTHKKDRHGYESKRTDNQAESAFQQEMRQRWRALLLTIKAKLEAVECGISTLEEEFLAHIVLPNQITVGEWLAETALPQIKAGRMPTLLLEGPKKSKDEDVQDAEIVAP